MKKLMVLLLGVVLLATACSPNKDNSDIKENTKMEIEENKSDMKKDDKSNMKKDNKSDMMDNKMAESKYDFNLVDLQGNSYKLSDQKGKKVYVKFWASWCPICLSGLNDLNNLSGMKNDFEVITIVSPGHNGEKSKEEFLSWFNSLEYKNIKVLLDVDGKVFSNYGVRSMPTNAIIDSKGNVVKVVPGPIENNALNKIFKEIE